LSGFGVYKPKTEMLMKQTYISPDLQQYLVACEQGFSLSGGGFNPDLGGWGDGGSEEGSAD